MKLLAVAALVCALMALSRAEAAAEPEPDEGKADASVAKRCHWHHWHHWKYRGWTKIGHRYFYYNPHHLTWRQAERRCAAWGGHLASVHSHWEYKKIRWLIRRKGHGDRVAWIGGSDRHCEGHWCWSDGSCFNFRKWCCGEPNNAGNQDCLQINFSHRKCWDDAQCWLRRPSVCVKR
ncbi:type-2 ice-structuring protein-like [Cheilinus undulatus]|uniref:type-2 ice-structuring protein-like n=1 Tax=Cheilinus undulatus TaxID=241271 RepID=UPI001BD4FBD1|nr:type-2 ice-structuring protein-like [Cheilinus undulatus]